ncbi:MULTISPECIES: hypothetical protein [unclassified Geodermatophilus]
MSLPRPQVPDVDRRITVAYQELGTARDGFRNSPSGEGFTLCQAAQQALDDLLDLRLTLTAALARTLPSPA